MLTVEDVLNELELEVEVDHEDFDEPMMPGSDDEFERSCHIHMVLPRVFRLALPHW